MKRKSGFEMFLENVKIDVLMTTERQINEIYSFAFREGARYAFEHPELKEQILSDLRKDPVSTSENSPMVEKSY